MTKVCAVWYARSVNIKTKTQVVEVTDDSQFKTVFGNLLFDSYANYLLINYKNTLYMIEAADRAKRLYNRRVIQYHPLSNLVQP